MSTQHCHTDRLPTVSASAVMRAGWINCPNCKKQHGLFYRRDSDEKRTLNYLCNKVKHYWYETFSDNTYERWRNVTRMGEVEFVDGLPIREDWTAKCKATFQKEHTDELLK